MITLLNKNPKLQFWKRASLSLIGKIKVLNIFILSRLWYQTEFQNIPKNLELVVHQGILDFTWVKENIKSVKLA